MEIEVDEELDFGEDIGQDDLLDEEFDAIEQSWQEEVIGSQDSIQTADRTTSSGSSYVPSQPAEPVWDEVDFTYKRKAVEY